MKRVLALLIITMLSSCARSPYRFVQENEIIESPFVSFIAPDKNWMVIKQLEKLKRNESFNPGIFAKKKGGALDFNITIFPYKGDPYSKHFNKNYVFKSLTRDSDMTFDETENEQGITYKRAWTVYVAGLKCGAGVFSRTGGGFVKHINSKNYNISCGYYQRFGSPQLMWISYRYHYAGGPVRHQKDKDSPQQEIPTLEQTELYLKQSVKKIIDSLVIKDMDMERMRQEDLLHPDKGFEFSPY